MKHKKLNSKHVKTGGFTLIELLVSMAILSVLMLIISQVIAETQAAWRQTSAKVAQFRDARAAFDAIKRNLSQATLNTYVTYRFNNPGDPYSPFTASGELLEDTTPANYERYSELQFVCGPFSRLSNNTSSVGNGLNVAGHGVFFQAPLGLSSKYVNMPTALNPRGYFVSFGGDSQYRPTFLNTRVPQKFRYRLMEYAPSTERNLIYDEANRNVRSDWFADWGDTIVTRPLVDNVVALYFSPRRPLKDSASGDIRDVAPDYFFDSAVEGEQSHQLPPMVDVVMVVVDEPSAALLSDQFGESPPFTLPKVDSGATDGGFEAAIDQIEAQLVAFKPKVNFRIFSATVALKNSKWGLSQ